MSETMPPRARASRALLIWAVTATSATLVLGNIALLLWVRLREARATINQRVLAPREMPAAPRLDIPAAEPVAGAFENLKESDVMGRYRFFEEGSEVGTITLLPSHSMINK